MHIKQVARWGYWPSNFLIVLLLPCLPLHTASMVLISLSDPSLTCTPMCKARVKRQRFRQLHQLCRCDLQKCSHGILDALLEALGDCSDALGSNNFCAIVDLYNAVTSTCNEADAAAEIPALLDNAKNDKDSAVTCPERDFPPQRMVIHLMVGPCWMAM